MDVIEAHARRLPPIDDRWTVRPNSDAELERGLMDGGVSGTATHPLDNVRGNILMLLEGDPDKEFGMPGIGEGFELDGVLGLVEDGAGAPIDRDARYGTVEIAPASILAACAAVGDRLARAARAGEAVVLATGHPVGLALLYSEVDRLLTSSGADVLVPAPGLRWSAAGLAHDWFIDHYGHVVVLTDGREPRHTHSGDPMRRVLEAVTPDLVVADHGFAGAAIHAGIETVSIADVNDPALLVAKARGLTETVVVMDDHVEPDAYWPCFQAIAARF